MKFPEPATRQVQAGHAPEVQLHGVELDFNGLKALNDVSFTVEPGSIHAVIGPNGAGKSSLLNTLSGIYPVTAGSIMYAGRELTSLAPHQIAQRGIARTFQNIVVSPDETVLDNLMVGRHSHLRSGFISTGLRLSRRIEREHAERVRELAHFVGIDHLLGNQAGQLPYGDLKRLELVRALCIEPRLLILDEPVAGMSTSESARLGELVASARDQLDLSVIFVEHDMGVVMSVADRITVLDFGKVITTGTPHEIRNHPSVIEAYLGRGTGSAGT